MTRNAILDELHAARQELLAEYDGDTAAYLRDAKARLEASGRSIAKVKQKTIRCTEAAKSSDSTPEAAKSSDSAMEDPSSPLGDR